MDTQGIMVLHCVSKRAICSLDLIVDVSGSKQDDDSTLPVRGCEHNSNLDVQAAKTSKEPHHPGRQDQMTQSNKWPASTLRHAVLKLSRLDHRSHYCMRGGGENTMAGSGESDLSSGIVASCPLVRLSQSIASATY